MFVILVKILSILKVIFGTKSSQQFHGFDHPALNWSGLGESRQDPIFFCHCKNVTFPHKPILYFWLKKVDMLSSSFVGLI